MTHLDPSELARRLDDVPRYVDLRGLLLSGRCELFGEPGGYVVRALDFPFAAVGGLPSATAVHRAIEGAESQARKSSDGEWHLLVQPLAAEAVGEALPAGWRRRGVRLHRWTREPAAPAPIAGADLSLLPDGHASAGLRLDRVPTPLRNELDGEHARQQPMAVALVDGHPVAFCYAAFFTETLWDVAVDTLEAHRRRGLAAACFHVLAAHLAARGRRPVWGALLENEPSLRLAAKLGFVADAELKSFVLVP